MLCSPGGAILRGLGNNIILSSPLRPLADLLAWVRLWVKGEQVKSPPYQCPSAVTGEMYK